MVVNNHHLVDDRIGVVDEVEDKLDSGRRMSG